MILITNIYYKKYENSAKATAHSLDAAKVSKLSLFFSIPFAFFSAYFYYDRLMKMKTTSEVLQCIICVAFYTALLYVIFYFLGVFPKITDAECWNIIYKEQISNSKDETVTCMLLDKAEQYEPYVKKLTRESRAEFINKFFPFLLSTSGFFLFYRAFASSVHTRSEYYLYLIAFIVLAGGIFLFNQLSLKKVSDVNQKKELVTKTLVGHFFVIFSGLWSRTFDVTSSGGIEDYATLIGYVVVIILSCFFYLKVSGSVKKKFIDVTFVTSIVLLLSIIGINVTYDCKLDYYLQNPVSGSPVYIKVSTECNSTSGYYLDGKKSGVDIRHHVYYNAQNVVVTANNATEVKIYAEHYDKGEQFIKYVNLGEIDYARFLEGFSGKTTVKFENGNALVVDYSLKARAYFWDVVLR